MEKICKILTETEIKIKKKTTDNISSLRNGLNWLIKRTTENEIVIKAADKGSIIYFYVSRILLKYVWIAFAKWRKLWMYSR